MTQLRSLVAVIGLACMLTACASTVPVTTHHDPEADFSRYRSFTWIEPGDESEANWTPPPHLDRRFRRVVDDTLTDKGLERAPVLPMADLLLVYYAAVESELRVTSVPYGHWSPYQYGYWHGSPYGATEVRRYHEGTIVLDIIDRKAKRLVWTGSVTKAITRRNPPSERIAEVVEALLEDFPPQ